MYSKPNTVLSIKIFLTCGSGYVSGSDKTGGELGVSGSVMEIGVLGVKELRLFVSEETVTVPMTVTLVGLVGSSFAARCSARSLSKGLLLPVTVRRSETVCALQVRERVHGFPVSSFQTPQCLSGSYSLSLRSERSALSLLRLGCPLELGLLLGLEEGTVPENEDCRGKDSKGEFGAGRVTADCRFA